MSKALDQHIVIAVAYHRAKVEMRQSPNPFVARVHMALLVCTLCAASVRVMAEPPKPSSKNATQSAAVDQAQGSKGLAEQVARASALLQSPSTVDEGLRLLSDAARKGDDEARYVLGWLYMRGKPVAKDNDRALEFLNQVGGIYRIGASILMGGIRAEGSRKVPANKAEAQRLFDEAAVALEAQLKEFQAAPPPTTPEEMARRKQWRDDWIVLDGMASEYGLIVPRRQK